MMKDSRCATGPSSKLFKSIVAMVLSIPSYTIHSEVDIKCTCGSVHGHVTFCVKHRVAHESAITITAIYSVSDVAFRRPEMTFIIG